MRDELEDYEREAEQRYRQMTGMDLPLEERRAIAKRNRDRTELRAERPTWS